VQSSADFSPFEDDVIDLPDRPSIAILAFDNLSNDPEQDYLGDGLAEDLITSVSYLRNVLVIARHSAFTYKDKPTDVTQIGRELGVRHVLEGSVRKFGDQIRITAQLVDTATRDHLWAKRFDVATNELFSVQDTIVEEIVTALNVELVEGEQARGWNRSSTDPEAYDLFLRAREVASLWTEDAAHLSIELADRATKVDPDFAMGWAQRGRGYEILAVAGWSEDLSASWEQGIADAKRAVTLDSALADAHTSLGSIYMQQGKYDEGIKALEKAVELSPNNAESTAILSVWLNTVNRSDEALALIKKALRLNPSPPDNYFEFLGWAYHGVGQNESAALAFDECVRRLPDYVWCLLGSIASNMAAGQEGQARSQVKVLIKVDREFSLEKLADMFAERDLMLLQSAGVPE
jgi:adenylate cyclase